MAAQTAECLRFQLANLVSEDDRYNQGRWIVSAAIASNSPSRLTIKISNPTPHSVLLASLIRTGCPRHFVSLLEITPQTQLQCIITCSKTANVKAAMAAN